MSHSAPENATLRANGLAPLARASLVDLSVPPQTG